MQVGLSDAVRTRVALHDLEVEAGLTDLSDRERCMIYAAVQIAEPGTPFRSDALRRHPLVERLTHPTYHRILRGLIARGLIALATPYRAGHYVLKWSAHGNGGRNGRLG